MRYAATGLTVWKLAIVPTKRTFNEAPGDSCCLHHDKAKVNSLPLFMLCAKYANAHRQQGTEGDSMPMHTSRKTPVQAEPTDVWFHLWLF